MSNYDWKVQTASAVTTGSQTVKILNPFVHVGGPAAGNKQIFPFAVGQPVKIVDGVRTETVVPTVVVAPTPQAAGGDSRMPYDASFTATFGYAHAAGVDVVNATSASQTLADQETAQSLALLPTEASATPPLTRAIRGEVTLSAASVAVASSASVAGVRGMVTVKAITAGYLYGTQGKLTVKGTLNNGSNFNAGLFGQLDVSDTNFAHTSGYMAPIMADFSTAAKLSTDALADMMVLLNTSQCLINSILKTEAKANFLFDLNDLGQGAYIVASAKGSGWDKSLKIKLNGDTYYIPCNPDAS